MPDIFWYAFGNPIGELIGTGRRALTMSPQQLGDDPSGRRQWFVNSRQSKTRKMPAGLIASASAKKRATEHRHARSSAFDNAPLDTTQGGVNWTPLGPLGIAHGIDAGSAFPMVSGRITCLAIGPGGEKAYAGSANGGAWRTTDSGANWVPLDDLVMVTYNG